MIWFRSTADHGAMENVSKECEETEVLIIGAGVLGVSLAYHLAARGVRSIILEKEISFAHHASGKNAGMFRQLYRHPQLTEWAYRSIRQMPAQIREQAFQPTGSMVVSRELPNHHSGIFEQRSVQTIFEGLSEETSAVYTATDGLLDSPHYVALLYQHTQKELARYHFRSEVTAVTRVGKNWEVETATKQRYRAPWVVNAAGAWLNRFLLNNAAPLQVKAQPFARHLFVVKGWEVDFMPVKDVGFYWEERHHWYIRLWEAQTRLVSICDQCPTEPEIFTPDPEVKERLAERLLAALPEEAQGVSLAQAWHCFRTYTEDQLPIWGEDESAPGLFWLAAFGGFGMSTSFAATEDAARHINGESVSISSGLNPSRVR